MPSDKIDIDVWNNPWMIMFIRNQPEKGNPVWIVRNVYHFITLLIRKTQNSAYKQLREFLNKKNIKIFLCFQY